MRRSITQWMTGLLLLGIAFSASARETEADAPSSFLDIHDQSSWILLLPAEGKVPFRGMVDYDDAGVAGQKGVMYPGNDAGTFLVAVLTHGLLVDASRKNQLVRMQDTADQVLDQYRSILADFSYVELMGRAQALTVWADNGVVGSREEEGREWLVESIPVFTLTQDQKALVLDNAISLRKAGSAPEEATRLQVRVVSQPRSEREPSQFWTFDRGVNLKEESARLVAHSLDVAFIEAGRVSRDGPQRSLRYLEGGTEKIERAQLLQEQCGRFLLRNLRGVIMSVPAARATAATLSPGECRTALSAMK